LSNEINNSAIFLLFFLIKTGKAKSPPACEDLKTYLVKVEKDKIFIKL